jgi:NAD(P)-dependent dehydrogenase (short-subunit alcohol dehydrogenase family)
MMAMGRRPFAIVTGAGRGLGRLITLELAAAEIDVLMVGRDSGSLSRTAREAESNGGGRTYPFPCDLESPMAIQAILAAAEAKGGADILINNAAIQGPIGPAWENDAALFSKTFQINFLVPVALARSVLPYMLAHRAGWIINISGGGATGPRPMFSAYGAAKTALVRFGETLAAEVAAGGVRVNSVAPGAFRSGMTHAIIASGIRAGDTETAGAERLIASDNDDNACRAAKLIAYLVAGEGRDVTGKLISALWDPWNELHRHWQELHDNDVYTLRRIMPADRRLEWG